MPTPKIPSHSHPIAGGNLIDIDWFRWLQTLDAPTSLAALTAQVQALQAAIAALGSPHIVGSQSVEVHQNGNDYYIWLNNDQDNPGPTYYYGTGPDGVKGWFAVADAVEAAADELTKAVDAGTGVTTFGLADVTPDAGGTLQLTTFDEKGRRSEEDAATAADLPYDNATSGLAADDVQAAIDELAIAVPDMIYNRIDAAGDIRVAADGSLRITS